MHRKQLGFNTAQMHKLMIERWADLGFFVTQLEELASGLTGADPMEVIRVRYMFAHVVCALYTFGKEADLPADKKTVILADLGPGESDDLSVWEEGLDDIDASLGQF